MQSLSFASAWLICRWVISNPLSIYSNQIPCIREISWWWQCSVIFGPPTQLHELRLACYWSQPLYEPGISRTLARRATRVLICSYCEEIVGDMRTLEYAPLLVYSATWGMYKSTAIIKINT